VIDSDKYALTCGQRFLATRINSKSINARPLQRTYELCKDFDYTALCTAVQRLVQRHPALHIKLVQDSEGWTQCFLNEQPAMTLEKVKGLFKLFRIVYAKLLIAEEPKRVLDLTNQSPVKIMVVKVNNEFIMSICLDHLAVDEISYDLVEKELLELYCETCSKVVSHEHLADNFLQYIGREQAQRHCERENSMYWYHQLRDAPIGGPPPGKKKMSVGECLYYQLQQPTLDRLLSFCQAKKSSVSHLITAIQLKLLAQAAKIDDVVIGIPISNRIYKKDEHIIGDLVMPIFIRFQQFQHKSLAALIVQVRDICMVSMAHRQYDYAAVMNTLSREHMQHKAHICLNVSNNFIIEHMPIVTPNRLFVRRLDNIPGRGHAVAIGSFNIDARQNSDTLSIDIKWDPSRWLISAVQVKAVIDELIKEVSVDDEPHHTDLLVQNLPL